MSRVPPAAARRMREAYRLLDRAQKEVGALPMVTAPAGVLGQHTQLVTDPQDLCAYAGIGAALTALDMVLPRVPCANPECGELLVPVNGRLYHSSACQKRAAGARHRAKRTVEELEVEAIREGRSPANARGEGDSHLKPWAEG